HVFFCDSGSVSVEVAIKMCLQYWKSLGHNGKRRLLTWRGGYHGDTFHPMSVCDPDGGMHALWHGILPSQVFADLPPTCSSGSAHPTPPTCSSGSAHPTPPTEQDPLYAKHLAALFAANADELAAVIVEPVVQGAGGMRMHHPSHLRTLRELCDQHQVLLIFDEIATGFGRTGELFAAEHAGIAPDVLCLGKALTGGYLSMAATLCTPTVSAGIARGSVPVLAHGPTFMANPLACAVSLASIDLLLADDWRARVRAIEARLRDGLTPARELPGVADVRILGAIGVLQLDHAVDVSTATRAAARHGVWLRPFRDLIYTMPPYICTESEVDTICAAMIAAAEAA
ncbi:MAG: adenosylmethionine--8-amino-7-oxononanoate transaminase, partial [Sciscionella sp.]|nr:adenosylmethionine--8-amino-7-oxononanoate transaminase [Sciscionella sp.]